MEDKLLYRDEVYAIQGALFDVYKTMGNMWGEEVYQQCLEKELSLRNIPFEAKKELPIFYKGEKIEKKYIPDVFCFGRRTPSADSQLSANDEVQAWAADQFRLLSSRDHRAIRALI